MSRLGHSYRFEFDEALEIVTVCIGADFSLFLWEQIPYLTPFSFALSYPLPADSSGC